MHIFWLVAPHFFGKNPTARSGWGGCRRIIVVLTKKENGAGAGQEPRASGARVLVASFTTTSQPGRSRPALLPTITILLVVVAVATVGR